jgi:hypothetical protein
MHLKDGEIMAYLDGEAIQENEQQVQSHLDSCDKCHQKALQLQARSSQISEYLASFKPGVDVSLPTAQAARVYFYKRLKLDQEKEYETMLQKIFRKPHRPAWVIAGVVILLAVSMIFAPVRALANNFLGLFRVESISVVEVNPANMPDSLGRLSEFDNLISQDMTFEGNEDPTPVNSWSEAASASGYAVRSPASLDGVPEIMVTPAGKVTFKINLERVRAVLQIMDRGDVQLPESLDGSTVSLEIFPGVSAQWGNCNLESEAARAENFDPDNAQTYPQLDCTALVQMPSPNVNAPSELDIMKLGEVYLEVLGMDKQAASRFARSVDWTTTLVLPIPGNLAKYQQVQVDVVNGIWVKESGRGESGSYILMWVKDGILYALTGNGKMSTALEIGNSMK